MTAVRSTTGASIRLGTAGRWRRLLPKLIAFPLLALITAFLVSYVPFMLAATNESVGVRSVEWVREHGGAWLVSDVEAAYYSITAPSKGGRALTRLPLAGGATSQAPSAPASYRPQDVAPPISARLPGEGVWRPASLSVGGAPTVLVTTLRPERDYPSNVAGLAWIDSSHTRLQLFPGRYEPPGGSPRGPLEVPPNMRYSLAATFNSAFKVQDAKGGFATGGHTYVPLIPGLATLVADRQGRPDVRAWQGGPQAPANVSLARQNLPLILNHGSLNPNLGDGPIWGATLGNRIRVWRSAIGIDRRGNLIYAVAPEQTVSSIALLLKRAGAVRAMELDINSFWVSFISYGPRGARHPSNLLQGMSRPPSRYLSPDDRDFFAVFAKAPR